MQRESTVDVYVFMSLLSCPVSPSRSLLDARTPNPNDRLRVISLSPLTHTQIFICAQPSQCTVWHQQSCATRTRPCGDLRDLEKMSQNFSSLAAALLWQTANVSSYSAFFKRNKKDYTLFADGLSLLVWISYRKMHFKHNYLDITL